MKNEDDFMIASPTFWRMHLETLVKMQNAWALLYIAAQRAAASVPHGRYIGKR